MGRTTIVKGLTVLFLSMMPSALTHAQQVKISGYMFGDAYALATHEGTDAVSEEAEGQTGLWFRRIYLTFDFQISDSWKARLRSEMNSPGDFSSRSTLVPYAKDAYVQWQNDQHRVTIGLSETPTWTIVEGVWGYRSVEKTFIDLQRFGSSRDIGVAFKGSFDADDKVQYNIMLANGGGTRSEDNKGKKAMLSLAYHLADAWVMEVYSDFEDRPGDTDRLTLQGFAGYQQASTRLGFQYVYQRRQAGTEPDIDLQAFSVFGATRLAEKFNAFARFDKMLDANPDAGGIAYLPFNPGAKSNMLLLGVDYFPIENVHFMPNVEVVFYDETDGYSPTATVMPRLTFFVTFG